MASDSSGLPMISKGGSWLLSEGSEEWERRAGGEALMQAGADEVAVQGGC